MDSLRARFKLELSDAQAAAYMKGLVLRAYDKWTTGGGAGPAARRALVRLDMAACWASAAATPRRPGPAAAGGYDYIQYLQQNIPK